MSNAKNLSRISDLCDPEEDIMTSIFGSERFPDKAFCDADILNVLRSLGLKSMLSRKDAVECCDIIAVESRDDMQLAHAKGSLLLGYIDINGPRLFGKQKQRLGARWARSSPQEEALSVDEFCTALQLKSWVPVIEAEMIHPCLPRLATTTPVGVMEPLKTRSVVDCWLCSTSMGLVKRSVQNTQLREVRLACKRFVAIFQCPPPPPFFLTAGIGLESCHFCFASCVAVGAVVTEVSRVRNPNDRLDSGGGRHFQQGGVYAENASHHPDAVPRFEQAAQESHVYHEGERPAAVNGQPIFSGILGKRRKYTGQT
jgi:hypothetical protein